MTQTAAIYGFEFTRQFTAAGLNFTPFFSNPQDAKG